MLWGKGGRGFAVLLALVVALVAPAAARADAWTPPGLLEKASENPGEKLNVIILAHPADKGAEAAGKALADVDSKGKVRRKFDLIDGVAASMTAGRLSALAQRSELFAIVPDAPVGPSSSLFKELWPKASKVEKLWSFDALELVFKDKKAPAIAVVDSGVDASRLADFGARVTAHVSFTQEDKKADDYGHGTLVAGFAASSSAVYPGAAPTANIVSLRVLDKNGRGVMSDVIAAADWIYKNRAGYGIRVANFSLNSPYANWGLRDPLNMAVRQLWLTGTTVVTAAGNTGSQRMLYAPASEPFVITVGATDPNGSADTVDDFNAPWSSYGYTAEGFAKPEIGAPGRYMTGPAPADSTLAAAFPDRVVAAGYMWMSGTSFAAAATSGVAAQVLAHHPDWSPDEVKGALMLTARPLANAAPLSVGVGAVDAEAAVALVAAPDANAHLKPFVTSHPATGLPVFSAASWAKTASGDASWASASWASASWASASWSSASWASASWSSASWASASWASASWASASWASASWASASWASASWAQ